MINSSLVLTAHQPAYLPWLGYFDKINRSDIYVFLDSVQFERGSYINRNKIKTKNGPFWLTIPVKIRGYRQFRMDEIEVDNSRDWSSEHLKSVFYHYGKAKMFNYCYPKLEKLFKKKFDKLSDLCFYHLEFWLKEFNIKRKIIRSSELKIKSKKSDLIFDICRYFKASKYISGALGINYLDVEKFKDADIETEFQNYQCPIYPQLWGKFVPNLGIIDFWMNTVNYKNLFEAKQ
jgi:hypothetical protein